MPKNKVVDILWKERKRIAPQKKVPVTTEMSEEDLNFLEDFLMCVPLCDTHKKPQDPPVSARDLETMYYVCKDCEKVREKWRVHAINLYSRLCRNYYSQYNSAFG